MPEPLCVRVCEVRQYVRNVRTRMPFRYGAATLTRVPILHLRTTVEAGGRRVEGWSADCLPPAWFDKRPGRTFRQDVASLRRVVELAIGSYLGASAGTPFELWLRAYHDVRDGALGTETGLTCGFGSALVERSVIDAAGKLAGTELHETVRRNLLGLDLGAIHPELAGTEPADWLPPDPRERVFARHCIGLADPLTRADIAPGEELDDGLPQAFEEYLVKRGIRYVKVKLQGRAEADLDRVRTVAELLERHRPEGYVVTLDGNEMFASPEDVLAYLDTLAATPGLERFLARVEYFEQPLPRAKALDPAAAATVGDLVARVPVAIDESDDAIDAYRRAIALGYPAISMKNCKGVEKAIANACLAAWHRARGGRHFLTGEDLMNTTLLPVMQDLATASVIGLVHVERNGHHFVRGLTHLSPREVAGALDLHRGFIEPYGDDNAQVAVHDGQMDLRSLRVPGYGVAVAPDWEFLTPLEDWRFEDLGLEG